MKAVLLATFAAAALAACPVEKCAKSIPSRFTLPAAYEAYVAFSMPYFNFTEKAYVWAVNRGGGAMRLSYNGGANVFIQNNLSTKRTYQLYPAEQSLLCSHTEFGGFSNPFPKLELFCRDNDADGCPTTVQVNGIAAHRYTYVHTDGKRGDYNYITPDEDGYGGEYHWYQDATTGQPIRFHTVIGHNVVFGGSHFDEYAVDYLNFQASSIWPESEFFLPPVNMPCTSTENPFGPTVSIKGTKDAMRAFGRDQPTDFHAAFPEGAERRKQLADAHAAAHAEELGGKPHSAEAAARLASTARYVAARNRQLVADGATYTVGLTQMAHMSGTERRRHLRGFKATAHKASETDHARVRLGHPNPAVRALGPDQPADECTLHKVSGKQLPDKFDVSQFTFAAKDQGNCGSCWAFGATGAIEGAIWSATKKEPHRASEQNLMDCTWYYGNNACEGGNDYTAFSFLIAHNDGKIATDDMYGPYTNKNSFCRYDLSRNWTTPGAQDFLQIGGCVHVNTAYTGDEVKPELLVESLKDAMVSRNRPVSVAIDASHMDFYYYTGGLYYNPECGSGLDDLDHQVLAVAYKTVNGQGYFQIKNSWSNHWGEDGHAWISMKDNNCGVSTSPNYILAKSEVRSVA